MNTEQIVAELQSELEEHVAAGKHVAASHCRQQIIAQQTVAWLRAEHERNPSEGLASQIRSWVRKLDRDVDTEAGEHGGEPAEEAHEPAVETKPKRRKGPGGVDLHSGPAEVAG